MDYRTVGIFAHIDSGKTTLTERILFEAGKISAVGSIEDGTTESDTLKEEIERGISIRTTFHSIQWKTGFGEYCLQIVDTPGHIDFKNQITDILPAIQIAIVILEGGSSVQSQARLVIEELRESRIPIVFFINKLDRFQDDYLDSLISLEEILGKAPEVLFEENKEKPGEWVYYLESEHSFPPSVHENLLKWSDELLLSQWNDPESNTKWNMIGLSQGTRDNFIFPIYGGSAKTGQGVKELLNLIAWIRPKEKKTDLSLSQYTLFRRVHPQYGRYAIIFGEKEISLPFLLKEGKREAKIQEAYQEENGEWVEISKISGGMLYYIRETRELDTTPGNYLSPSFSGKKRELGDIMSVSPFSVTIEPESESDKPDWLKALANLSWEDPGYHFEEDPDTGQIHLWGRGELHIEIGLRRIQENSQKKIQTGSINIARFERLKKMAHKVALEHRAFEDSKSSGTLIAVLEDTADFSKQIAFEVSLPEEVKNSIEAAFFESTLFGFYGREVIGLRLVVLGFEFPGKDKEHLSSLLKVAIHSGMKDLFRENTILVGPMTEIEVSVDTTQLGVVLSELNRRSAKIHSVDEERAGKSRLKATASAENLLGFSGSLRNMTKGIGISWERTAFTSEFYAVLKE
ncbi:elongation factor G-like protein [Leptospira ilyithenensis]|uniref:Elongation factor G-like protein n=1 Tax=Leptospira ilyithenensis TaxID=2484901 RepID=A0A4R9LQ30_9LEPT|nr:elongation factor G-like protein [Leptospira ilyithenensis]TGN08080.1 elongation factor G-like protein [Leptospira ilyithenensis]